MLSVIAIITAITKVANGWDIAIRSSRLKNICVS